MKKQLLTLTMAVIALGAFAQNVPTMGKVLPVSAKKSLPTIKSTERGGASCANDTLHYPYVKELIQTAPDFGGFGVVAGSGTMGSGYAQKFTNTSSVTISGVEFWGFVLDRTNTSQSLTVNVGIFAVNGTNQPTTSLGTTTVTLTGITDAFYTATFSTPITTSSNYAVVLTNPSTTDTLGLVLNNATTSTYGEGLGSIQFMGAWYPATAAFTAPGDYEAVMAPIVSYPLFTNFTVSANPTCIGTTLNFTNTTTTSIGHLTNKMYNWNVFSTAYALAPTDSTYAWDMDDASPLIWSNNASHAYAAAGSYDASLYTLAGFWKTCLDGRTTTVVVDPNTVAGFTSDATNTPTIAFTNTTTGATSYSWDFGDGSPADNSVNPSHTYSTGGNYTVTLTATGPCGTNTSTTNVNIAPTGINTYEMDALSVYPNPSNGLFTLKMNATAKTVVEIYNVIGELVYSTQLTNNASVIDLTNNAAGVYTMKVISGNSTAVKQIVLTK